MRTCEANLKVSFCRRCMFFEDIQDHAGAILHGDSKGALRCAAGGRLQCLRDARQVGCRRGEVENDVCDGMHADLVFDSRPVQLADSSSSSEGHLMFHTCTAAGDEATMRCGAIGCMWLGASESAVSPYMYQSIGGLALRGYVCSGLLCE